MDLNSHPSVDVMSQVVTKCHMKWKLIQFIFVACIIFSPCLQVIGENLPKINCSEGLLEISEISCDLKKEIVAIHNEFRQQIAQGLVTNQPPATNMQEMFWDDELAHKAQQWSHYCTFAHSDPKYRADGRFNEVGENLGQTKSKIKSEKQDFKKHIQRWFNENEKFHYGIVVPENLTQSGHYTQLASANTYMVGCGFSRFRIKNIYHRLYVCHYGPSGNHFYQPPYEAGNFSCKGDLKPSKKYPNLCTRKIPPLQLDCPTPTTAIIPTLEPTISFKLATGGRRFLDMLSSDGDIISSEDEQCDSIANDLGDEEIVNNIYIENMYNLIFLNNKKLRD